MTTASLTLTGSIAALTAALQAFDTATEGNSHPATPTASTDIGLGTPAPMPLPSNPSGAALTPIAPIPPMSAVSTGSDDEDEEGEASDGTGVDAEGLPWDARIHSSSKKKTAKGLWVSVRGGPKGADLAAIKDELRGVTQVPMPLAAPAPTPVLAPIPVPEPVLAPIPMPMPVTPTPEPVAAMPQPIPMPAPATEEWDFAKLMAHIGPKMGSTIDPTYLAAVCQHYGLGSITDSATKPEVIGQLVAQFQADGRW